MCGTNPTCNCPKRTTKMHLNLAQGVKETVFNGRKTLVVPLVMAISTVVMNGALVPEEEYFPPAWNGVPVTASHPTTEGGGFLSANTPESILDWCIGRVFNAEVKEGKLCAEAYIDIVDADRLVPGLVAMLKAGKGIDVSTGYFADVEESSGELNGEAYQAIHRNLRPDHLAILPNEDGACSWEDGCGVRANKKLRSNAMSGIKKLLGKKVVVKNAEPAADPAKKEGDDVTAMADKIIGCEDSPFTEADKEGLCKMSSESLQALAAMYGPKEEQQAETEDPPVDPAKKTQADATEGEDPAMKGNAAQLSAEDKAALNFAKKSYAAHKSSLVDKIVANSRISKADAEKMDVAALEIVANGIKVEVATPDYSGRALPALNADEGKPYVEAMTAPSAVDAIRNRNKKG